ncbi:MAG: SixA phosphatase family protein [Cyanobacteriota bacterium]|jgi:phosphohistidine phosphatase
MAERDLILLRHGLAEPHGSREDDLRALTPEGRQRTLRVCQRAVAIGLRAGALITSPLTRARQTGEIAVEAGLAPALTCSGALAPGADPWPLIQHWWAGESAAPGGLILVGHEPDLGDLVCRLIGAPAGAVGLKKAGIALLSWPGGTLDGPARLRLLLSPRSLAALCVRPRVGKWQPGLRLRAAADA